MEKGCGKRERVRKWKIRKFGGEFIHLLSFIESGYDHIHISPNQKVMKLLNKYGFIEKGFPYYGWLIAIHTAVLRIAVNFNINLIF